MITSRLVYGMRLEALRSEVLSRFGDVFLAGVGAHLDVVGLRPQKILVNQHGVKSKLGQFVHGIIRPGLVLERCPPRNTNWASWSSFPVFGWLAVLACAKVGSGAASGCDESFADASPRIDVVCLLTSGSQAAAGSRAPAIGSRLARPNALSARPCRTGDFARCTICGSFGETRPVAWAALGCNIVSSTRIDRRRLSLVARESSYRSTSAMRSVARNTAPAAM